MSGRKNSNAPAVKREAEEFGYRGSLGRPHPAKARRIAGNVAKLPELLRKE